MKPYFSILALISAATASCGNVLAEAIEGYPVIIYDTSDSPVALGTDLNEVIDYIDGSDGDTAELHADITITSTLAITKDTFINIVSDGNLSRTITGEGNPGIISSTATSLTLNCENITFADGRCVVVSGDVNLGGKAAFSNNTAGAILGNLYMLKNSSYVFGGNFSSTEVRGTSGTVCGYGGAVYGNFKTEEGSTTTFTDNFLTVLTLRSYGGIADSRGGAVCGDIQIRKGSTVVFSNNYSYSFASAATYNYFAVSCAMGGAIYGENIQIEEGATAIFSGNCSISESSQGGAIYSKSAKLAGNIQFENNSTYSTKYRDEVLGSGGAIWAERLYFNASVSGEKIIFLKNKSEIGGAIYVEEYLSTSSVSDASFSKNEATKSGGAIYGGGAFEGTVDFSENTATKSGGAICGSTSFASTSKSTFSKNLAELGGAIYSYSGKHSFAGTVDFSENTATAYGGAIYGGDVFFESTSISSFVKNSAVVGGAIYGSIALSAESETLFTENSATEKGGAIYATSEVNLFGSLRFDSNVAGISGGALYSTGTTNFGDGCAVEFTKNSSVSSGGAIYAERTTNFTSGCLVSFIQNSAKTGGAIYFNSTPSFASGSVAKFFQNSATNGDGGAIYFTGTIDFSGESEFTENSVTYNWADGTASTTTGGAIAVITSVSFATTSKATFSGNSITATEKIDTRGGAIYSKSVSLAGDLIFENNVISAVGSTSINSGGGAIYADGAVTFFMGTTAKFTGNTIRSKATQSFGGGAIFADTVSLAGNVEFTNNTVTNSTISTMFSSGGAIFAFSGLEFTDGTAATFLGNSAAYGGAINSYKGYLTFTENTKAVFSGNSAARGGAIYADAGTFTLAGDVQFLNNTASAQGGAIRLGETTLVCEGDTTKVVFSGNKVGSDTKGWTNNDILLVKAISSMTIRDAGTYEFGGGIDASAGGTLSISDANVTFQSGSITKLGGVTTISGGANVTIGVGTTFDLVSGATFSVEDYSVLTLHTNLSEATVITVAAGASVAFEETAKLIIDISMAAAASAMLAESDGRTLVDDVAKIAIIRADDEAGIGDLGNVELLVNGAAFNGEWNTLKEGNTFYLTVTIPEPSAFGLLAGLSALALVGTRRRRK